MNPVLAEEDSKTSEVGDDRVPEIQADSVFNCVVEVDSPFDVGGRFRENDRRSFSPPRQARLEFIDGEPSCLAGVDQFGALSENLAVPIGRGVIDSLR